MMARATDSENEAKQAVVAAGEDIAEAAQAAVDVAEQSLPSPESSGEPDVAATDEDEQPAAEAEPEADSADSEAEQEAEKAETGEGPADDVAAEPADEAAEEPVESKEAEPEAGEQEPAADETDGEPLEEVSVEGKEAPAETPPPEPDDGRAWYVVHCYSGDEEKVKHNLEQRTETMQMSDQIFQVVVPTEDEIEIRNGKRRTVERRVFPGYILVQMLLTDDSWYVVRNTPGVTGFVGMGNEPTPLRPEEVQAIVRRMEVTAPKIKVTFKSGQKVRIIDGPFNEFIGLVDEIDMERAKVRVLVSFFGRETPVELDFLQVEKT